MSKVDSAVTVYVPVVALLAAVTVPLETVTPCPLGEIDQLTVVAAPLETLTFAVKLPVFVPFKSRFKVDGVIVTELTFGVVSPPEPPLFQVYCVPPQIL